MVLKFVGTYVRGKLFDWAIPYGMVVLASRVDRYAKEVDQ
jgi:hypothetical protein